MSNKYKKIYDYCTKLRFTISCKALEEKFLRDKKIKRSYFLYSFIFSQQKLKEKDFIELSIAYISTCLACSKNTVIRHMLNLESNGYLIVKKNTTRFGFNRPNSYSVTLPKCIEKELDDQVSGHIEYDESCEIYTIPNIKYCG